MKRANTNPEKQEAKQSVSFTIIVDEDVATYIEQQGINDTNSYMNQLLNEERDRQRAAGSAGQNSSDLMSCTPDASGYPEMQGHFRQGQ